MCRLTTLHHHHTHLRQAVNTCTRLICTCLPNQNVPLSTSIYCTNFRWLPCIPSHPIPFLISVISLRPAALRSPVIPSEEAPRPERPVAIELVNQLSKFSRISPTNFAHHGRACATVIIFSPHYPNFNCVVPHANNIAFRRVGPLHFDDMY